MLPKSRLFFIINLFLLTSLIFLPTGGSSLAQESQGENPEATTKTYFAQMLKGYAKYSIGGRATDTGGKPLESVRVADQYGNSAYTNKDGYYTLLNVPAGSFSLAASKSGYMFTPAPLNVTVPPSTNAANFTGYSSCQQLVTNGGFEKDQAWVFPSSPFPAAYTNSAAHSGSRSVRTGILDPSRRVESYSDTYQNVTIPSNASSALLRIWLFPMTGITAAQAPEPIGAPQVDSIWGNAPLANDAQYVLVINPSNGSILETLVWWEASNAQTWTYREFNLVKYSGRQIRLLFGTYNNNSGGVTSMYVDDVSLEACPGATQPPNCYNLLGNPGFEATSSWSIPNTAYPASYSTARAYSGSRSMRTGIPNSWENKYSYSDAYQDITIPSTASSAQLNLWIWPGSGETPHAPQSDSSTEAAGQEEGLPTFGPPAEGTVWGEEPLAGDAQYILVINPSNGQIRETLMWLEHSNASAWINKSYDLLKYRGQSIRIQFGTYNDGGGGVTFMYVDEAYANTCTSGSQPPPSQCGDYIANGGYETDAAWYIPTTAYSAGYSTTIYRSGYRGMRTGIYYASHNTYSYSDVNQTITLPSSLSSAKLAFYMYPISGESGSLAVPDIPDTPYFGDEVLSSDVQYLLILDQYGNWIDTLIWERTNQQKWVYREFSLAGYKGRTIKVQFGTFNDGGGGVTANYLDDVSLWVCP
jgi:hypothetical protein